MNGLARGLLLVFTGLSLLLVINHQRWLSVALAERPMQGAELFAEASPIAGEGWRAISWRLTSARLPESRDLDSLLLDLSLVYPMEGMLWLRRAEIAATLGVGGADVASLLDLAVLLSPYSSELLWRAAVVSSQVDDDLRSLEFTRRLFIQDSGSVNRALPLAIRAGEGKDWLQIWLEGINSDQANVVMSALASRGHFDLAAQVRSALGKDRLDPAAVAVHVRSLFRSGAVEEAAKMWAQEEPSFAEYGVANADFAWEVGKNRRAFDWTGEPPASVLWRRDFDNAVSSPASLQWYFSGEHNIDLDSPRLPLLVQPARRYALELQWRGADLTSAALPRLQIVDRRRTRVLAELSAPSNAWSWSAATLEFTAPEDASYVYFRLAREPTGLLNRQLGGSINVDRLRLQDLGPVER